jgi:hypothetical protein
VYGTVEGKVRAKTSASPPPPAFSRRPRRRRGGSADLRSSPRSGSEICETTSRSPCTRPAPCALRLLPGMSFSLRRFSFSALSQPRLFHP